MAHLSRSGFKGTRFVSSTIVFIIGTVGWFMTKMSASEWIQLSTLIMGLYGASEVGAKASVAFAVKQKEKS